MNDYNPFTLTGKTILITGASSGIGRATAIECSKMGATLVITARNSERLNKTLETLEGTDHTAICAELTDETCMSELVDKCSKLDGIFFCAGVTDTTLSKFITREKIMRVFEINLISPMLLTKMLLSKKKINKNGSLVYMSSYGAERIAPGLGIYSATKAGINSLSHATALELANRGIRSNTIMPAMVKTELIDTLGSFSEEDLKNDEAKYPLGYGKPEDVAFAAVYLLSDASKWVTGSQIKMDGGCFL